MLRQSHALEGAERCFREALEKAKEQMAKSFELRAAMSLARLRTQQDRKYEARRSLEELLRTFDEGLETADLKDAKQLLKDLP